MSKNILRELPELLEAGIITKTTAEKITQYYEQQNDDSPNRLVIIFSILGALLVGLGIILIIAHNWDNLSRFSKTIIAFLPLVAGQIACVYTLLQKKESISWAEGSASFLILAIGASISLISQIYNIPGDISSFMLTWCLLSLPLVYIMNSSMASLLYISGITFYGTSIVYDYPYEESFLFWGLLLLIVPHYYQLVRTKPKSNFTVIHHLFVAGSIAILLYSFAERNGLGQIMFIAYSSLFGIYYLIGKSDFFNNQRPVNNFYLAIGSVGSLVLLIVASFKWFWEKWAKTTSYQVEYFNWQEMLVSLEFLVTIFLTGVGVYLLLQKLKTKPFAELAPFNWTFLPLFLVFFLGKNVPLISMTVVNLLVFSIGILTIRRGVNNNHLGFLNYGLLMVTILIFCRFFDLDLSFVTRGILFVLVGIGFFIANYLMLQKRKQRL